MLAQRRLRTVVIAAVVMMAYAGASPPPGPPPRLGALVRDYDREVTPSIELKIGELRRRAQAALGGDFDLRQFHDAVLEDGAVPLSVLEAKMERWIAERRR